MMQMGLASIFDIRSPRDSREGCVIVGTRNSVALPMGASTGVVKTRMNLPAVFNANAAFGINDFGLVDGG